MGAPTGGDDDITTHKGHNHVNRWNTNHYERVGSGPPLVDGGGNRPAFEERFTVYAYDRRDRANETPLEQQFEDVAAIVESIDEPVVLYGHSIGALRSLEAVLRTDNLRKLILYEPPLRVSDRDPYTDDLFAELTASYDEGEYEQVRALIFREITELTPAEIDERRSNWQDSVDTVDPLLNDDEGISEYEFDATRFAEIHTPTLLLVGSESPQWLKDATDAADDTLPNSRIAVLDGQAHFGTNTELFSEKVLAFIQESQ